MTEAENAIPDYPRGITFEQVWAALMEDRKRQEEIREKTEQDRARAEQDRKENDRLIQKIREKNEQHREELDRELRETNRTIDKLSKQMGGLHRSFGELAEHLVAPGIARRFNEMGYHFDSLAPQGIRIYDESRQKILTEVDILLENSECLMAVEVKVKPAEKDIAHHIGRLEILRDWREKRQEKPKRILGAIAGAVFPESLKEAVIEAGLYVIEQSGDTMKISVPEGFKPYEW
jgi:hypothetical protein